MTDTDTPSTDDNTHAGDREKLLELDKNIYILIPSGVELPIRMELAERGFLQCNIRSTDYKEEVSEGAHSPRRLVNTCLLLHCITLYQ